MSSSVDMFSQQSPPFNIYSPSFREQYGINQPLLPSEYPSCHPSSNPSPSPYPMPSDTSALSAALPQGMRSASSASPSASAAPSRAMRSSSILAQPSSASQILKAGNNGALTEYTQIAHHLRDIGTISNKQLNTLLKKYIDI